MPGIPSLATSQIALMVAWQFWILYNYSENARAAASIQLKPGPLLREALLKSQHFRQPVLASESSVPG